jgi:hypothetical protein
MTPEAEKTDRGPSESKTLSIQIESSPPMILAISQLFRLHKQPKKSVELCRQGLAEFPGDLSIRLAMALGYLDLDQKEEAGTEISAVTKELHQLSSVLERIAEYFGQNEKTRFSEWLTRLSQILAQYPAVSQNTISSPEITEERKNESLVKESSGQPPEGELVSESNVISTLDSWVTQLKK